MNTLIVSSHPRADSLTASVARRLSEALPAGTTKFADLHAEGFDPRFSEADRVPYQTGTNFPADVAAEQARLDWADEVVLVFPVYWWSFPAMLKGWIDRVFINGWAFDVDPEFGIRRKLGRMRLHMIPLAGDTVDVYARHGYLQSLTTQIEHGIVDFCGIRRGTTAFLHESEQDDERARTTAVDDAIGVIVKAITRPTRAAEPLVQSLLA